jgi:hypothetical protein
MNESAMHAAIALLTVFWLACNSTALSQDSELASAQGLFNEIFGEEISDDEEKLLRARELWERLAAEGDPSAQYFLSFLYRSGLGGVEKNEPRSIDLVEAAAEAGYPPAQFTLAMWYESGENLAQDWDEAVEWYQQAATQGHVFARARLHKAYTDGDLGLPIDSEQARLWQ